MANEVGTATNLEDLFSKIVNFLTTNATLVAGNEEWEILRIRRDNLASLTSNLTDPSNVIYRKMIQTCRYDSRSLNTNDPTASYQNEFYASSAVMGTSQVTCQLTTAREVRTVRLRSPASASGALNSMLRNFRLQYSDNGTSWTTALTVNSSTPFTAREWRDYSVPAYGSHLYWRIIIDSVQSGSTTVAWANLLMLEADGTVANHFGSEVNLKAPGASGTEEIFTGIRSEYDIAAGWYNLFLNGYSGFDPMENSWFNHPGAIPGFSSTIPLMVPMVPCWNTTMPYWLVATGRSFRFALKVSTSYEGGYLGYILPYSTPGQYPYPLAVGGSLVPQDSSRSAEWRYSYANWRHGVYPGPGCDSPPTTEGRNATLYLRNPQGEWVYFSNRPNNGIANPEGIYGMTQSGSAPYTPSGGWRGVWPHCTNDQWYSGKPAFRECLGGGYILQPCVMMQRGPYPSVFGELEGTYSISGYQNSSENTTTWDGKTVVVFQNAYRNTIHEYWALSLD